MSIWDYIIGGIGTFLQGLILFRGLWTGIYRHYPFFYSSLCFSFLESLVLIYLFVIQPPFAWAAGFWLYNISPLVGFLTTWEVYRQIFARFSAVQVRVGKIVSVTLLFLVGISFAADFAARPLGSFPVLAIEWQSRLAQATLLAASLLTAKYYCLPLGKNVIGMAVGFGLFVSLAVANLALRGQFGEGYPVASYVYRLSILCTYCVWAWSLWQYAPNPTVSPIEETTVSRGTLSMAWAKTFKALKKGFGR